MKRLIPIFIGCLLTFLSEEAVAQEANPCCTTCDCYLCEEVESCYNLPPGGGVATPAVCTSGDYDNCGADTPNGDCLTWTENYYPAGEDAGCVPIDGGLGFLIAGALGMGVIGTRRREKLALERG